MPLMTNRIGIVIASALLCGCSRMRATTAGGPPPTDLPPQKNAARTPTRGELGGISKIVCRSSGIPSGYVAIDYLTSRDCPALLDRPLNAMLVEDISFRPLGTVMRICLGQRQPADWDPTYNPVAETSQCPRDGTDVSTSPTVMEIVRRRGA